MQYKQDEGTYLISLDQNEKIMKKHYFSSKTEFGGGLGLPRVKKCYCETGCNAR